MPVEIYVCDLNFFTLTIIILNFMVIKLMTDSIVGESEFMVYSIKRYI